MNTYYIKAKKKITPFLRKWMKAGYVYLTAEKKENTVVECKKNVLLFKTARTKEGHSNRISTEKLIQAGAALFFRRTLSRKELEAYGNFNSSIMGLLLLIFSDIAKKVKEGTRLIRITLKDKRFFFAACDRAPADMRLIKQNGGSFLLMTYYHLRDDINENFRRHLLDLDMNVIFDSGEFSRYKKELKLQKQLKKLIKDGHTFDLDSEIKRLMPPDITVEEYAAFILRHKDIMYGYFNLDRVGDAHTSQANFDYLAKVVGVEPYPIWHAQSSWDELDAIIAQNPERELIGIGGTVFLSEAEREQVFKELFRRYPEQRFHGLGVSSALLFEYPFFSV